MSMTARSTATSSAFARSSRRSMTPSTASRRSMALDIDTRSEPASAPGTLGDIRPGAERPTDDAARGTAASGGWRLPDWRAALSSEWVQRLGRALQGHRGRRFSSLTARIIALNLVALGVLIAGVIYINLNRADLITERLLSLETQGRIIADALADGATRGPQATSVDDQLAQPLLQRLIGGTAARARLYAIDGALQLDTRYLVGRDSIETYRLPPPGVLFDRWSMLEDAYDWVADLWPVRAHPLYSETINGSGFDYAEVRLAATGAIEHNVRVNDSGDLVLSVALPVQRFNLVLGILFLTTEGDDIDAVLRAERLSLIQIFLVAFGVLVLASFLLARTIARPVRRLAEAADKVRYIPSDQPDIPNFTHRGDEIGDLSASLNDMTRALYGRITAIEQFAADVAHEIKNPLTSLKSAIETFSRAKDDATRRRLIGVIEDDVQRINRLVSDISNASRLDAELAREVAAPVDMLKLLETITLVATPGAEEHGVTFDITAEGIGAASGFRVFGHAGALGQVFSNLLDNAVSFSPHGGTVRLTVRQASRLITTVVEDEGPGIPEDELEKIFARFYTSRPDSHGFGKNSGLGLAISRQIVEVHGGTIRAENRIIDGAVAGARFVVTLPAAPEPKT
ncbi:MAG: HAMP domain-containing protein [Alphaproteobacteria bacterium]|nr:HAMP domain-containing protein [Alphaproteobacteria bacterium]